MKPIAPQEQDGIPRAVATAMLTEPRARLTNRMRKNCIAARDKVFASSVPFRRMPAHDAAGKIIKGWGYAEIEPRTPEDKVKRRFATASLRQLGNWLRRSIVRRGPLQRKYLALQGDSPRTALARELIALAVQRLDTVRDVCEDEITMRKAKCDSIKTVPLGFGSSVKFVRCE